MDWKALWEKEKWYWLWALVVGVVLTAVILYASGYEARLQRGISAKVVRFHVLANSDSEEDQALKLAVRDRVLQEYADLLGECENKEETLAALEEAKQSISETALAEVREKGYAYPVRVSVVREEFPEKTYDTMTFPAGVYDALRIEIGEGKGQNWWCVLYPQMCFVDAAWGYGTQESTARLSHTLTEEEFLLVAGEEERVQIKWKIKEFLGDAPSNSLQGE